MATMISEVYAAFLASGAPEDKARKAAEAIAAGVNRFNKIENDLNLLKWMNGITWAVSLGVLFKLFLR
ncbi:MAG: integrase [Tardiphaga sp.]